MSGVCSGGCVWGHKCGGRRRDLWYMGLEACVSAGLGRVQGEGTGQGNVRVVRGLKGCFN